MRILLLLGVVTWHATNLAEVVAYGASSFSFKRSIKHFAPRSFKAIAEYETGNFVYSPVGASLILTMMTFGARARTEEQMRLGLRLPVYDPETKNEIRVILNSTTSTEDYVMYLTNKMFYNATFRLKDEFIDVARSVFKSPPGRADFADFVSTTRLIDAWTALQTNNCITEISDPWSIYNETKVVLTSAAYFKGKWRLPFASELTEPREFYVNGKTARNVTTMFVSGYFRYGELPQADATYVEIPFKVPKNASTMSMYVILPNARNGLRTLVRNFHEIDEFQLLRGTGRPLNIYLPRFKVSSFLNLRKPLDRLGFYDMFTRSADFSGIIDEPSFTVRSLVHKASIEVDEDGDPDAVPKINLQHWIQSIDEFRVDHPFVCVIMKEDGIPLFIASIKDPRG